MNDSSKHEIPSDVAKLLDPDARRIVRACLTIMGSLGVASWIGVGSSLYLLTEAPLVLIALSPLGRHLVLVAAVTNPIAFVAVAVARRLVFYLPAFYLGRTLGDLSIVWLERRVPLMARWVNFLERIFKWSPTLITFVMLGPLMSAIAGNSGMTPRTFAVVATAGLTCRMVITVYFAEWVKEPLEVAIAWLSEYRAPGTAILVGGLLINWLWKRRKGARGVA
jgi:membrane protein DedA with SNARE-associated domain